MSYNRSVICDLLQQADEALVAQEHEVCTALVREIYALFDAALMNQPVEKVELGEEGSGWAAQP